LNEIVTQIKDLETKADEIKIKIEADMIKN
jgi:uncharacterized protein Yka (UPF0111/DUF47 family)